MVECPALNGNVIHPLCERVHGIADVTAVWIKCASELWPLPVLGQLACGTDTGKHTAIAVTLAPLVGTAIEIALLGRKLLGSVLLGFLFSCDCKCQWKMTLDFTLQSPLQLRGHAQGSWSSHSLSYDNLPLELTLSLPLQLTLKLALPDGS